MSARDKGCMRGKLVIRAWFADIGFFFHFHGLFDSRIHWFNKGDK